MGFSITSPWFEIDSIVGMDRFQIVSFQFDWSGVVAILPPFTITDCIYIEICNVPELPREYACLSVTDVNTGSFVDFSSYAVWARVKYVKDTITAGILNVSLNRRLVL